MVLHKEDISIIVVDDLQFSREVVKSGLGKSGYSDIRTAASADDALHLLAVTDSYTNAKLQEGPKRGKIAYHAELEIDAAAIATVPQAFLKQLQITPEEFIRNPNERLQRFLAKPYD